MATITIMDPVTRIEGHLKVEVTIDKINGQNEVVDARCTGTLFRGFELILNGRDPWDAPVLTQRICGVCPISHAQASVLALEDVGSWHPYANARLLRNLTLGANFVQSHILHFYLLASMDFVRGPQTTPWTPTWDVDMRGSADSVMNSLPRALEARRRAHEMGAIFGGRMPTSHTYIPGGFTAVPKADKILEFQSHLNWLLDFIRNDYLPDVQKVAETYSDYFDIGTGCGNLLAYGVFETSDTGTTKLLGPGFVKALQGAQPSALQMENIREAVRYSWYQESTPVLDPSFGETQPVYPKGNAYSWLKAPRYGNDPCEVGPLARMWIKGDYRRGISVMDRHAARAAECLLIAENMETWLNELDRNAPVYRPYQVPDNFGIGLTEAPRGALGHWVQVNGNKISHYQVITPTCWNASPKDHNEVPGPMEQALLGTPIENPDQPLEALRVIHSFDPCLSCAVHVMRPGGKPTVLSAGAVR